MMASETVAKTGWLIAALGVLGAFLVIGIVLDAVAPAPSGPALSSLATSPQGVAAWAELLARDGHPVSQLRTGLAAAHLSPRATLVVLAEPGGTPASGPGDGAAGLRFLASGGRLVTAGLPLRIPAALAHQVIQLGDPGFLENAHLAEGDNAVRALSLAGAPGRPIVFDEAIHGYGPSSGLAALPGRWWASLAGIAVALAAWALSRARRLGGPDPIPATAQAPRRAYVDALAVAVGSARERRELRDLVNERRAAEARLAGGERAGRRGSARLPGLGSAR